MKYIHIQQRTRPNTYRIDTAHSQISCSVPHQQGEVQVGCDLKYLGHAIDIRLESGGDSVGVSNVVVLEQFRVPLQGIVIGDSCSVLK